MKYMNQFNIDFLIYVKMIFIAYIKKMLVYTNQNGNIRLEMH